MKNEEKSSCMRIGALRSAIRAAPSPWRCASAPLVAARLRSSRSVRRAARGCVSGPAQNERDGVRAHGARVHRARACAQRMPCARTRFTRAPRSCRGRPGLAAAATVGPAASQAPSVAAPTKRTPAKGVMTRAEH
eukprot:2044158-Pleurochrysis_carterae.AAC.1